MDKRKELLAKIIQAHPFIVKGDDVYRQKLEKALIPYIEELVSLGVRKSFVEGVLYFGKEFIDSFRYNRIATVDDLQNIFGCNVDNLSETQEREYKLAKKHNALMWKSSKLKDGKVSIKVLEYLTIGS